MQKTIFYILIIVLFTTACNNTSKNDTRETARKGTFKMLVDESFKPIIDSQIEVFISKFPNVKINVEYTSEAQCYKAFEEDSTTRLIITSRGLTEAQEKAYHQKFDVGVMYDKVALDAVAVILNPSAPKDMLTMEDLKDAILGKSKYGYRTVFDGKRQTSNARFVKDSILKTDTLPSNVSGVDGNKALIDFVSKNPTAMGFIGVNWIGDGNPDDLQFNKLVKVAGIQCQRKCPSYVYKKPYQANIATKEYALVRGIYYTVKNDYGGVATNFAKFLEQEAGQLIFKAGFLVGTKQQVFLQDIQVTK